MLLTSLYQVRPGMRAGAALLHPLSPSNVLLRPGVELTEPMLVRLRELRVPCLWVEHHLTSDLDDAVNPAAMRVRLAVYTRLREDLSSLSQRTITNAQILDYRETIGEMVRELVTFREFAGLADQLYDADAELISHCSNVAYIATLIGLELESYIVRQRPRVADHNARNLVNLGLGAMLHDIGKITLERGDWRHEALDPPGAGALAPYNRHPDIGYGMLRNRDVPPTVRHVVLAHHRRFDGSGWPAMGDRVRDPAGAQLHVFVRIVAAANALESLLRDEEGRARPPVAALCDLAGPAFDGWFDPIVRRAALRRLPPFAIGTQVELSDGQAAVVVTPNMAQPCRPAVRLLSAGPAEHATTFPLADRPELSIVSCAGVDVRKWIFTLDERTENQPPAAAA